MSGIICPSYKAGFASPQRGRLKYPQLWRGCVGAWAPLLGPSGATLRDESPYGRHATLTSMDPATDWTVFGGVYALNFDGVDDYVQIPGNAILSGLSNWTIMSWFCQTGAYDVNGHPMYCERSAASGTEILKFEMINTPALRCTYRNSSSNLTQTDYVVTPPTTSLSHGVVTLSDGVFSLYYNGTLMTTKARLGNDTFIRTDSTVRIGGDTNAAAADFEGNIAETRIYTRALTGKEIKTLATRPGIACETTHRRSYKSTAAPPASTANNLILLGVG